MLTPDTNDGEETMTRVLATVGLGAALFATAPAAAMGEAKEVRFGVFFSERANVVGKVLKPWAKWFEEKSAGAVKVKFFFGGTLGRNPREQYKLVRSGIMDIGFVVPSYTPGTFPDFDLFQAPNLARNSTEGSYAVWQLYKADLIRNLDKIEVLGVFSTGAYSIHTVKPVKTIADLKGMKLRAGGRVQNRIVTALGATPVGMRVTKIAENISRGLLDGSVSEWNAAETFKILKVTKSHFHTSLGVLPIMVVMNKKVYEALPDKAKMLVPEGVALMSRLQGAASDTATAASIAKVKAADGSTYTPVSAADRAAMKRAFAGINADLRKTVGEARWQAYEKALKEVRGTN